MQKNIFILLFLFLVFPLNNYCQDVEDTIQFKSFSGGGLDSHGCSRSAGARWSILKNDCIIMWTEGKKFIAYGTNPKPYLAGYVIVSKDRKKVEFFSAYFKESIILDFVKLSSKNKTSSYYENKQNLVKIYLSKGKYYISINNDPVFIQDQKMNRVFAM